MQNSLQASVVPHPNNTDHKMFKLVVLCAFLAAAVAEPSAFLAPITYSSVLSPARAVYTNQASSVIHPSPLVYSTPWLHSYPSYTHLIKKRSVALAPISSYIAPSTYFAHAPFTTAYAAPSLAYTSYPSLATTYGAPIYSTAAHLIKKRSAPLIVPSTYTIPTIYRTPTPLYASTYAAAAPIYSYSSPYLSAAPLSYAQWIKK